MGFADVDGGEKTEEVVVGLRGRGREGGREGGRGVRKMRGWRRTRGGDKNIDENYKHKHVYVSEGQGRKQMIKEARWWLMMTMTCMLTYQGCS